MLPAGARNPRAHLIGRRGVVALLLAATTINYVDRQTLSVLAPLLQREMRLTSLDYSYVVNSFLVVYSICYVLAGAMVDRLGTRRGLGYAVVWWSLAEMLHAFATGLVSLCVARALLAVGEAAIIPAGVKAISEWFEDRERGLAVGIFEMGLSIGPILAPPLVVWIAMRQNWRYAFLWTGATGLVWAIPWLLLYRRPAVAASASASDVPWAKVARSRSVLAVGLARFFGDPVWYFYLFWLPKYLADARGLSMASIGAFAWIPFVAALAGGLAGGGISSRLVRAGMPPVRARQAVLLASGLLVSAGVLSVYAASLFGAMLAVSAGAFAMQCWGANLDTLPTDLFPSEQVARAVGLCGLFGSVGGILFMAVTGYLVQHYSYTPVWIATAVMYPVGYLLLRVLLRGYDPNPHKPRPRLSSAL
ncbi:MAG TPA: MFS transporter [Bryobacteraceae bacterium]|nr:MFS transporter [Bryobacteraceae bacterium]